MPFNSYRRAHRLPCAAQQRFNHRAQRHPLPYPILVSIIDYIAASTYHTLQPITVADTPSCTQLLDWLIEKTAPLQRWITVTCPSGQPPPRATAPHQLFVTAVAS